MRLSKEGELDRGLNLLERVEGKLSPERVDLLLDRLCSMEGTETIGSWVDQLLFKFRRAGLVEKPSQFDFIG